MNTLVDYTDRHFQLWEYTGGHGQLLLRSTKTEHFKTRVDILCKNVIHINLPTSFNGMRVYEADAKAREEIIENIGYLPIENYKIFIVSDTKHKGYVICGDLFIKEDKGDYNDPSGF